MRLHTIDIADLDGAAAHLASSSASNQFLSAVLRGGQWRFRVTHRHHELDTPNLERAVRFYNEGPEEEQQ